MRTLFPHAIYRNRTFQSVVLHEVTGERPFYSEVVWPCDIYFATTLPELFGSMCSNREIDGERSEDKPSNSFS